MGLGSLMGQSKEFPEQGLSRPKDVQAISSFAEGALKSICNGAEASLPRFLPGQTAWQMWACSHQPHHQTPLGQHPVRPAHRELAPPSVELQSLHRCLKGTWPPGTDVWSTLLANGGQSFRRKGEGHV